MSPSPRAHRRLPTWAVLSVAAVLVVGVILVAIGIHGHTSTPRTPPASAQGAGQQTTGGIPAPTSPRASGTSTTGSAPPPTSPQGPAALAASRPTQLSIPAIGVSSGLITLGLNKDGTLQVPAGNAVDHAGWFTGSPTPGQDGPAVILGHVESQRSGPSVFFRLGALKPGDTVSVKRADGKTVHYTVYKVQSYPKTAFPTVAVYGNTADPQLRLITCSGDLNKAGSHHLDNTVIYARETA
ncbi:class F sortase [Leekyejoonella antrihumi]|nr:class F sortase [Leekyejoonella antrihumi]